MSFRSIFSSLGAIAFLTQAAFAQAPTPSVPPRAPAAAGTAMVSHAAPTPQPESGSPVTDAAAGSAFTYQGLLRNGGNLAQGSHDFIFALYADSTGSTLIGTSQSALGVAVNNGFFTVALDFGAAAFDGNARWLDIQVRPAGGGAYTALTPRQALRPVPYATRAINGPTGSSQWVNDSYGIDYANKIGVGTVTNPTATAWINSGSTNNNTLYVTSNNGPWAALAVRNYGTNGWGIYDDTSINHYLYGRLGVGQISPGYPVDVLNNVGSGLRVISYGAQDILNPHPGEGVGAAMFVHGYTGSGAFGATSNGIYASSTDARAVTAWTTTGWGVDGNNVSSGCYGVLGTPNEGVFGYSPNTSLPAGKFNALSGGVAIEANGLTKTKTLQIMGGSDLAEPFDVARREGATPEPGSVVVIDAAHPGDLAISEEPYDTRVAGVISGANGLAPGMVMQSDAEHAHGEHAVALTGRVWCKVDASFGAVHPGDLLVSSPTPGYAMCANDVSRRAGAVLGKAMTSLETGRGLVLVLVSLQ
ncbi:MAG TPA: hypothetical protein VGR66_12045 [Candidatus Eisenbacteria bacterium]|nr:hypothetical protein [Candidatus Eisenbacteria bacterium]